MESGNKEKEAHREFGMPGDAPLSAHNSQPSMAEAARGTFAADVQRGGTAALRIPPH